MARGTASRGSAALRHPQEQRLRPQASFVPDKHLDSPKLLPTVTGHSTSQHREIRSLWARLNGGVVNGNPLRLLKL